MQIDVLDGLKGTELIQETFLFQLLNFEETLELARLFKRDQRFPGDVIIEEGELGQALYLIEKGEVKVVKGEAAEELAVLGRGELFGEMSLIENELTSASVIASSPVELLVIRRLDFERLLDEKKDLALKVYKTFCHTLSERLRKTSGELSRLLAEQDGGAAKAPLKKAAAKPPGQKPSGKKPSGKKPAGQARKAPAKKSK